MSGPRTSGEICDSGGMKQPFPSSVCHQCAGCAYGGNRRGSVFLRCTLRPERYLPQPMRRCPQFTPKTPPDEPREER